MKVVDVHIEWYDVIYRRLAIYVDVHIKIGGLWDYVCLSDDGHAYPHMTLTNDTIFDQLFYTVDETVKKAGLTNELPAGTPCVLRDVMFGHQLCMGYWNPELFYFEFV